MPAFVDSFYSKFLTMWSMVMHELMLVLDIHSKMFSQIEFWELASVGIFFCSHFLKNPLQDIKKTPLPIHDQSFINPIRSS